MKLSTGDRRKRTAPLVPMFGSGEGYVRDNDDGRVSWDERDPDSANERRVDVYRDEINEIAYTCGPTLFARIIAALRRSRVTDEAVEELAREIAVMPALAGLRAIDRWPAALGAARIAAKFLAAAEKAKGA